LVCKSKGQWVSKSYREYPLHETYTSQSVVPSNAALYRTSNGGIPLLLVLLSAQTTTVLEKPKLLGENKVLIVIGKNVTS
jgi:hypothetical protein